MTILLREEVTPTSPELIDYIVNSLQVFADGNLSFNLSLMQEEQNVKGKPVLMTRSLI